MKAKCYQSLESLNHAFVCAEKYKLRAVYKVTERRLKQSRSRRLAIFAHTSRATHILRKRKIALMTAGRKFLATRNTAHQRAWLYAKGIELRVSHHTANKLQQHGDTVSWRGCKIASSSTESNAAGFPDTGLTIMAMRLGAQVRLPSTVRLQSDHE